MREERHAVRPVRADGLVGAVDHRGVPAQRRPSAEVRVCDLGERGLVVDALAAPQVVTAVPRSDQLRVGFVRADRPVESPFVDEVQADAGRAVGVLDGHPCPDPPEVGPLGRVQWCDTLAVQHLYVEVFPADARAGKRDAVGRLPRALPAVEETIAVPVRCRSCHRRVAVGRVDDRVPVHLGDSAAPSAHPLQRPLRVDEREHRGNDREQEEQGEDGHHLPERALRGDALPGPTEDPPDADAERDDDPDHHHDRDHGEDEHADEDGGGHLRRGERGGPPRRGSDRGKNLESDSRKERQYPSERRYHIRWFSVRLEKATSVNIRIDIERIKG